MDTDYVVPMVTQKAGPPLNYESNRNANYDDPENTTVTWLQLLPSSLPHPRSEILSLESPVVICESYVQNLANERKQTWANCTLC
jgi:hypothetical protein